MVAARRWPGRLAALIVIALALLTRRSGIGVVVALFVLVRPFEKLFPRHRQPLRRPALATDLAYGLTQPLFQAVTIVAGLVVSFASLLWIPGLLVRPLVLRVEPVPRAVLAFLLVDMCTYWMHRFSHEVPLLWRFHAVHHSTQHLDWVSGLRNHPLEGALLAPPFVFLVAAGFEPKAIGALTIAQLVIGLFLHANVRWRLRPLHRIVITPEFHHWHHANEDGSSRTNYSVFLPIWDIVFGTYRMPSDRRPQRYGIDGPFPEGFIAQLRQPLGATAWSWRGARTCIRHPWRSLRRLARSARVVVGQMAACVRAAKPFVHFSS